MMYKAIENYINKTNIFQSAVIALLITNSLTFIIIKLTINMAFVRALSINSLGTVIGVFFSFLPAQILYKQLIVQRMNLITYYNTDALTGLLSRKPMLNEIQLCLDSNGPNLPSAFIMIDLDRFKLLNDLYGHQAGDEVMTYIGGILLELVDDNCIVGRFGGEEFIVYSYNKREKTYIEEINKLRDNLATNYVYQGQRIEFTASFGCLVNYCKDADIKMLIDKADQMLLLAKENGRNRIEYQFLTDEGDDHVV